LQSTIGNRPVQRLVASARLQPKLTLGAPDDVYEKEADAIAEQVMKSQAMGAASGRGSNDDGDREAMPGRSAVGHNLARHLLLRTPIRTLQRTLGNHGLADVLRQTLPERAIPELRRKCACGNESEQECSECSKNRLAREREAASERDDSEATAIVGDVLKTPGQPLTESARRPLEPRFGYDFSRVRAHDGSEAAESASAVKAAAYNVGNHIVFGKGRYAPGTNEGDRLLAHELTHTIQQTGGVWLGRDPARGEAPEGGLLQRDLDPQYQTSPSAATPDVTGAADDSGPVSIAPIQVAGEPHAFEMEGGCEGLHLHGKTDGTFDGGTGSVVNQKVTKGEGCNCDKGVQCFHVTGTLVTNYSVSVTITMPPVPSGLTACERAKVQAFLQNVLLPHEHDHEARLKTYNGQTKNPVDVTGCGQDDVTSKVQAIQDAEEPARRAAAQARSDAIDPFVRTIDCSDCEKQSAAPGAGQVGGGDTEIAAMRLPFSGHLRARAFTSGVDIVFDAGRYAPDSAAGRRLIAHELAPVIQQSQAGAPSIQRQPTDAPEAKPTLVKSRQALTEWIKDPTASGTLGPKAWADLHKVEEKFADIAKVTQVRKIFIGPAAVSDPENVNIVSDKDIHHYMPGLNFSEFIMGRGETFYVNAAGGPPIEKLNPSPTGPLPKIAIVLGKEVSSSKQMALTTVRHEMIHAEHLILTLKTVEKWQAAKTKDSFDDWLSEQNKKGKISTLEQELVTEEEKTNRPNTELLAYTEGFMTAFLLADPPPAKNDDPAFEQLFGMFMSGSEPWANANPETRSEALGRLQQYYCQVLDSARQKAFENWVGKPPEARPSSLSGWDWRPKRQMHAHFFGGLKKIVDGKCAGLGGAKPARPGKASPKSKSS
jgi:Domain of unknown function (DUF4157)